MRKIPERKTLPDGLVLKTPFVIRGLNLPCNLAVCEERASKRDMELFGYGKRAVPNCGCGRAKHFGNSDRNRYQ